MAEVGIPRRLLKVMEYGGWVEKGLVGLGVGQWGWDSGAGSWDSGAGSWDSGAGTVELGQWG